MTPANYMNHPMWSVVNNLHDAASAVPVPPTSDWRDQLDAVEEFLRFIDSYRLSDDYRGGLLVSENGANQVQGQIQQALSYVTQVGTDQWGNLGSAANVLTQATIFVLQNFPPPSPTAAAPAAKRALTTETNRLTNEVQTLRAQFADDRTNRDNDVSGLDARAQQLAQRLNDIDASVQQTQATAATRLNEQIDQQREAFDTATLSQAERFKEEMKARAAEMAEHTAKAVERTDSDRNRLIAEADVLMASLATKEAQAAKLVDSTSKNAIAADYGQWAKQQGNSAKFWTGLTVALGLGAAGFLAYALWLLETKAGSATNSGWQFITLRTGMSIIVLGVAGYCASQAAEHRREERTAKRLHLNLNTLEPFLTHVEEPEKLREDVGRRIFGADSEPSTPAPSTGAPRYLLGRGPSWEQIVNLLSLVKDRSTP